MSINFLSLRDFKCHAALDLPLAPGISSFGRLVVNYPEKPLEDFRRNLLIGDFPNASIQINPKEGGFLTRD